MNSNKPTSRPCGQDVPAIRQCTCAPLSRRTLSRSTVGVLAVAAISAVAMGGSATFTPNSATSVQPGTPISFDLAVSTVDLSGFSTADIIIGANGVTDLAFVYSQNWRNAFSNVSPVTPDVGFYDQDVFVGGNNGSNPNSVGTTATVGTVTLSTTCMAPGVYTVQVDSKSDGGSSNLTFEGVQEMLLGSSVFTVECVDADANCDGHVDLADHKPFLTCLSGPGVAVSPPCRVFDLNGDGDVDVQDHAAITKGFTNCK